MIFDTIVNWLTGKESNEEQKKQNRITNYNTATSTSSSSMQQMNDSLNAIEQNELAIDTQRSTIETYTEWLENYHKMLNGDRSETELGLQLSNLELQKQSYEGNVLLLQQQEQLAQQNAADYLLSSALQKENAYNTAFGNYTTMLKNQSLLNVAASAGSGKSSAYSMQSLLYNQQLKNYVGVDLRFNATNETGSTDASEGSFLREFTSLTQQIKTQSDNLNYAIMAAQKNIADNAANIQQSENAIKSFYLESETQANEYAAGIEDAKESIKRFEDAIEREKENAKLWQTNLLNSMNAIIENGAGGRLAITNKWYELYKEAGYEGSLEDFFNEVEKNYGWSAIHDNDDSTTFSGLGSMLTGSNEKQRDEIKAAVRQYQEYKDQYDALTKRLEEANK